MKNTFTKAKFWKNKKVLVTGHTGFKGSWLSLWLYYLGAKLTGLSLPAPVSTPNLYKILGLKDLIDDQRGDITHLKYCREIIEKVKPDIIIHMAAQPLVRESYIDPWSTINTNVLGTANLLEAARSCDTIKSIVIVTSDKCYMNVEKNYAFIETDPLGGYDPYSGSKACAEHVATVYYQSFFKDKLVGLATARAGNVIGGGDWSADRLIPDLVRAYSKDQKLIIRSPQATRPWQHVLVPLSGYLTIAECLWNEPSNYSGAWNFGPDHHNVKTVQDMVEIAVQIWGKSANWEISRQDNLYESRLLQLNSKKAQSILGWKPRWNFNKAVSATIQWYKNYYLNKGKMLDITLSQINEYEDQTLHG